jgi:hypothetical protein
MRHQELRIGVWCRPLKGVLGTVSCGTGGCDVEWDDVDDRDIRSLSCGRLADVLVLLDHHLGLVRAPEMALCRTSSHKVVGGDIRLHPSLVVGCI